jgi:signal recognition particle GTPase
MLADLERAKNETKHLESKKEELILKEKEIERNENERNKQLQHEMQLEETPQSATVQLFKMQSESTAAMSQLINTIIPKKTPLERYKESKAAITALLVAGDISVEVGSQLIQKLDEDLLNANML